MIDRVTVSRIMDATQIVEVVSDFVTLKKRGVNYIGLCPFHDDKTPSFYVSPAKGVCKCFACGKGGTAIHFLMEHEQLSYPEALKWLAKKYNIEVKDKELTPEEKAAENKRESMFVLNEWAKEYYKKTLYESTDGKTLGMTYFRQRGLRDDIIEKFQLGYSTSTNDAMPREALSKGYNRQLLIDTGLCYEKQGTDKLVDRYWGRVIFPWIGINGKVVGFGGRVLDSRTKGVSQKYINSPETEIYSKRKELYGLFQARAQMAKNDKVYLVEGYTDVISMHQCGITNVIANSGTALTNEQIKLIKRFTQNITLIYDGDEAGIKASLKGIELLLAQDMNIKVLLLPEGNDPDEFARKHNAEEVKKYIDENEEDFIVFKSNLMLKDCQKDPIKRAGLIEDLAKNISLISNEIIRYTYMQECARILHVEERQIQTAINKQLALRKEDYIKKMRETELPPQEPTDAGVPPVVDVPPPTDEFGSGGPIEMQPIPIPNTIEKKDAKTEIKELELIREIIRNGEIKLGEDEDALTVIEFIYQDLKQDQIAFQNGIYTQILEEAYAHVNDENFLAERYFTLHQDQTISKLAVDLISDKYQISKIYLESDPENLKEISLSDKIQYLIVDFKLTIVNAQIEKVQQEIAVAQNDETKAREAMMRFVQLLEVRKNLAKFAGERVVM